MGQGDPFCCPYCGELIFRSAASGERLKAPTSMLVVHKSGEVEINCKACKHGVLLPLALSAGAFVLRKAEPRYVVGLTTPD
jgi:hypothetical protein